MPTDFTFVCDNPFCDGLNCIPCDCCKFNETCPNAYTERADVNCCGVPTNEDI